MAYDRNQIQCVHGIFQKQCVILQYSAAQKSCKLPQAQGAYSSVVDFIVVVVVLVVVVVVVAVVVVVVEVVVVVVVVVVVYVFRLQLHLYFEIRKILFKKFELFEIFSSTLDRNPFDSTTFNQNK